MDYFEGLGPALRLLRQRRGMDEEQVSRGAGMFRQQLNNYERGSGLRVDSLGRILGSLGASLTELEDALAVVRYVGLHEATKKSEDDEDSQPPRQMSARRAAHHEKLKAELEKQGPFEELDDVEKKRRWHLAHHEMERRFEEEEGPSPYEEIWPPFDLDEESMRVALRALGFKRVEPARESEYFRLLRLFTHFVRNFWR